MLAAALLACAALCAPGAGRASSPALETAARAWEAGDYASALTQYLQILDAGADDDRVAAIALQTGELFVTREITDDGGSPRFSPDGRYLLFERGDRPDRITRVLRVDGTPTPVADLQGYSAAFSPDGSQLAYLRIPDSPSIAAANAAAAAAPPDARAQRVAELNAAVARESRLTVRTLVTGSETEVPTGGLLKIDLAFGAGGRFLVSAVTAANTSQIYATSAGAGPTALTTGPGDKVIRATTSDGTLALFTICAGDERDEEDDPVPAIDCDGQGNRPLEPATLGVVLVAEGRTVTAPGSSPAFSSDGGTVAYVRREGHDYQIVVAPSRDPGRAVVVRSGPEPADAPALSPDGRRVAYQLLPRADWEIYAASSEGGDEMRVTREIQHDVRPRFLAADRLIAMIGEPRHRRAHLYDLPSLRRTRLFHNNTVRTIAPEYEWEPSPDGARLVIVADRDGDTMSPARGVYLLDLRQRITRDELRARLRGGLRAEQALRVWAQALWAPLEGEVRAATSRAAVARVFEYEKALFDLGSKHVTRPGNRLAAEYLFRTYASFGYEPEYQTFAYRPPGGAAVRTSNVLATLKGTVSPEVIYVVSSHYDSVRVSPGADDNTSGTAALLETARILADRPRPATIVFASFTGEESDLLGSREFVRRALEQRLRIAAALNNDMIGWTNDHRLDNTIRYTSPGMRDVQHAAAMRFSSMITYDARYYRGTDAAAYYEAFGDIVSGIGSHPILGNPHYHRAGDVLETINHQLVTEVARATAASVMLLASSPSRVSGLEAVRRPGGTVTVTWTPSPERDVSEYIVTWGPAADPRSRQVRVQKNAAALSNIAPGAHVSVKAVNARGLEGWDWATVTVR